MLNYNKYNILCQVVVWVITISFIAGFFLVNAQTISKEYSIDEVRQSVDSLIIDLTGRKNLPKDNPKYNSKDDGLIGSLKEGIEETEGVKGAKKLFDLLSGGLEKTERALEKIEKLKLNLDSISKEKLNEELNDLRKIITDILGPKGELTALIKEADRLIDSLEKLIKYRNFLKKSTDDQYALIYEIEKLKSRVEDVKTKLKNHSDQFKKIIDGKLVRPKKSAELKMLMPCGFFML
jgi:uncharacterized phage infection (PIP) family protein YhgE